MIITVPLSPFSHLPPKHPNSPTPETMSISGDGKLPHLVLLPSAGMGHLLPFARLAATLVTRGCTVTFIPAQPTVSNAESLCISRLLDLFPTKIHLLNLPLDELNPDQLSTTDPFFLRLEAIRRSAYHVAPLLAAVSDPISAVIVDIFSASAFIPTVNTLNLPCYILFTSSAAMLALCAYFPTYITKNSSNVVDKIDIPGLRTIPSSSLPPPLCDPEHLFRIQFVENGQALTKADGILVNTFQPSEPEALSALNAGHIVPDLPPVFAIGPLCNLLRSEKRTALSWLDEQPEDSVVYVSFGSRTAMAAEQIEELADGLERSGLRFLWVLKTTKVDKEEEQYGSVKRVKDRGMIINGWVEQVDVLHHRAVGGFVSHCGWNSVTEAAMAGVRVLAWPRMGDQRVNAELVKGSGMGIWIEEWRWEAEGGVVRGEEIARRVKEMMEDKGLKEGVKRVKEEALKAGGDGDGSCGKGLEEFISKLIV